MGKSKSKLKLFKIIFILTTIAIFSSCKQDDINTESLLADKYSKREIFEGIFWGTGKLAKQIPSIDNDYVESIINNLDKATVLEIQNFKNDIYSLIITKKGYEFESFIKAMKSGDNEIISEELILFSNTIYESLKESEKYGTYFTKAEETLNEINTIDITNKDGEFNQEKFNTMLNDMKFQKTDFKSSHEKAAALVCFTMVVWNVGVVVNVAAAVNVAIGVNAVVLCKVGVGDDCFKNKKIAESKLLEREVLVNDISKALFVD